MNTSLKGLVLLQKCNQRLHASNQGLSQQVHCYYLLVDEYSRPLSVLSVVVIIQQPQLRPRTATAINGLRSKIEPNQTIKKSIKLSNPTTTTTTTTNLKNDQKKPVLHID
ncbi:hypothetical protein DERP_006033, partial [Dermatophagoides pteronyssinus]